MAIMLYRCRSPDENCYEYMKEYTTFSSHLFSFFLLNWQHVLEHGKPYEKAEIMKKLAGQIVQMSQHKFASNVVEKCLEFGGPVERQILISEMLGHTDENEPLQVVFLILLMLDLGYLCF